MTAIENATVLKPAIREYLGKSRVLHSVVVNFASENPEEWAELMRLLPASQRCSRAFRT
jgi:hypothetical protein